METDLNDALSTPQPDDQERLSQRLREAREYLGLSQEFVAEQLGIARLAVSAMETSKRKVSSLELKRLAKLYRRPYEYFLGQDDLSEEDREKEEHVSALYRTTKDLSPQDREQVLRFAQFLRHAGPLPKATQDRPDL